MSRQSLLIEPYTQGLTDDIKPLLLDADPDLNSILSYWEQSDVFVCRDQRQFVVGIALLLNDAHTSELINIAVAPDYQGQGIAKRLIDVVKQHAKSQGTEILYVGTGNSSLSQQALYQKCGFRMIRIERDFFADYPQPIFENGIECVDKVILACDVRAG